MCIYEIRWVYMLLLFEKNTLMILVKGSLLMMFQPYWGTDTIICSNEMFVSYSVYIVVALWCIPIRTMSNIIQYAPFLYNLLRKSYVFYYLNTGNMYYNKIINHICPKMQSIYYRIMIKYRKNMLIMYLQLVKL